MTPLFELKTSLLQKLFAKKQDWSIFIYNKKSAPIISSIFSKTDLLKKEIISLAFLEIDREKIDFPGFYFIYLDKESYNLIQADIKAKRYTSYNIAVINEETYYFNKLHQQNLNIEKFLISFKFYKKNIFLTANDNIGKEMGNFIDLNKIIEYRREDDLISPLVHFFSFGAFLKDNLSADFDGNELYAKYSSTHIANIMSRLSEESKYLQIQLKRVNSKQLSNVELQQLILEAPENIKKKEELEKLIQAAEDSLMLFKNEQLSELALAEQKIILGMDENNRPVSVNFNTIQPLLKSSHDNFNKLRLVLIYIQQKKLSKEELSFCHDLFNRNEITLIEEYNRKSFSNKIKRADTFEFVISRYIPYLKYFLEENSESGNRSLRRTSVFKTKNRKKILLKSKFFCQEELEIIDEIGNMFNWDIFIAVEKVMSTKEYINHLLNN